MSEKKDHKIQIWVAIIGLIGVIGAALIGNWDKFTKNSNPPKVEATSQIVATLKEVIFYKGDEGVGNQNSCSTDTILVREVYHLKNIPFPLEYLVLAHSSQTGTVKREVTRVTSDGLTDYNFCINKETLKSYPVKAVFIDGENNKSNIINHTISINGKEIENPEEWGKLFL